MKKRILSMILAIAMVASIFAGIAVTATAAEGNYVLTDALAVGDVVILATADGANVFTGIGGNAAKPIGSAVAATPVGDVLTSAEAAALTVEAGSVEGSVAFKMEDGTYLAAMNGNYLTANEAVADESSWIVTYEEGVASVLNVKESTRKLQYNASNPRFCAYTSAQKAVAFYKLAEGEVCTHAETTSEIVVAPTCLEAGSEKLTCTSCGVAWEVEIAALGHAFNEGEITVAATCTTDGEKTVTCTVCGETTTEVIEATGHDYVEGTCTVCGDVKSNVTFEKVANIVVGDKIIILTETSGNELVSVGTAYGSGAS